MAPSALAEPAATIEDLDANSDTLEFEGNLKEALQVAEQALALHEAAPAPDAAETAKRLDRLARLNLDLDRADVAARHAKRSLDIRRKALGPDHADVARSLDELAYAERGLKHYPEALQLFTRSLDLRKRVLGTDHRDVAKSLRGLARTNESWGRNADAERLYNEAIAVLQKSLGDDGAVIGALFNLASFLTVNNRNDEALVFVRSASDMAMRLSESEQEDVALDVRWLANYHNVRGQCREAAAIFRAVSGPTAHRHGFAHAPLISDRVEDRKLWNLQKAYEKLSGERQYKQALDKAKEAAAVAVKIFGPCGADRRSVRARINVARAHNALGDFSAAEKEYLAVQELIEEASGSGSSMMAELLDDLLWFYFNWNHPAANGVSDRKRQIEAAFQTEADVQRDAEATNRWEEDKERRRTQTLADRESELRGTYPNMESMVASWLGRDGNLHVDEGRLKEAEAFQRRALAILEAASPPVSASDLGHALGFLSSTLERTGQKAEASELALRALAIEETTADDRDQTLALARYQTALLQFEVGDVAKAFDLSEKAVGIDIAMTKRNWSGDAPRVGSAEKPVENRAHYLLAHAKMGWRMAERTPERRDAISSRLFEVAQWAAASEASEAIAQMGVRIAAGNPDIAKLVRERQNLRNRWPSLEETLAQMLAKPPAERDDGAVAAVRDELASVEKRVGEIDAQLFSRFEDYAGLVSPDPLTIADLQAARPEKPLLDDDEALVFFVVTRDTIRNNRDQAILPEETFIWAVTRGESRWVRSGLGKVALTEKVAALRCGLDKDNWTKKEKARQCRTRLALADGPPVMFDQLPFDLKLAHELYEELFAPIADLIKGKRLVIVPSGALAQLPFQVLVTQAPDTQFLSAAANSKQIAWLGRSNAVTLLPSVASLRSLRGNAGASKASRKPYVAFANPLLYGDPANKDDYEAAALAMVQSDCSSIVPKKKVRNNFMGVEAFDDLPIGGINVAELRRLKPVPLTADLVCDVAKAVGAAEDDVFLGSRATESQVKAMSGDGTLSSYAIVNFATHGVVAGELKSAMEPGLVLNPPTAGTDADNGYLSASEVAGLELDADWVILSACNTAAAGAGSAEALSGLARAFFYAGARSLLVSHWPVRENAAVAIVTSALRFKSKDKHAGHSEALKQAMLMLADSPNPVVAHPAYWAPFVLVGDAAAAAQ